MEPLTLKSLKSFIDDQINYTREAHTNCETEEVCSKSYYEGRLKALNIVMEEIDKWYIPTSLEQNDYNNGRHLSAMRTYRTRTGSTLQEVFDAFGYKRLSKREQAS